MTPPSSPATLSVVIIAFNEEKNIGACLDAAAAVADEIIVVDSFSTDGTVAIAAAKGCKVVQRAWAGYASTKNYANTLATGQYILSLDADEVLNVELQQSIRRFKQLPATDTCDVNRLTNYVGRWIKHSGWYPEYKTRIFRTGTAIWRGEVHEELVFDRPPTRARLAGHLLHYSYPTADSHIKKMMAYAALAAEKDVRAGRRYNLIVHGLVKPWFMFIKKYILSAGFLDGWAGFVIAVNSSFERFLRYVKFKELKR